MSFSANACRKTKLQMTGTWVLCLFFFLQLRLSNDSWAVKNIWGACRSLCMCMYCVYFGRSCYQWSHLLNYWNPPALSQFLKLSCYLLLAFHNKHNSGMFGCVISFRLLFLRSCSDFRDFYCECNGELNRRSLSVSLFFRVFVYFGFLATVLQISCALACVQ